MKKIKLILALLAAFTMMDAVISFFFNAESVALQTLYGLMKITTIMLFVNSLDVKRIELKLIQNVINYYWAGFIFLYLINLCKYSNDFDAWLRNFHDLHLVIPIFLICLFVGIADTFVRR